MRKMFCEGLPRFRFGKGQPNGVIDWKNCKGRKIQGAYDNIEFEVEIIDYDGKYLYIKYLDNDTFKIGTDNFLNCRLGKLLGVYTDEFKIEIGTHYKDDNRDLVIVDRDIIPKKQKDGYIANWKYYKYKCNKCGFECGEHYKNGEFKDEYWIEESNLLQGKGCACCSPSTIVVPHINSIVANKETHWMIPYFQGGYEEAKRYTPRSSQKIFPICPDCGRIKDKPVIIANIYKNKSIGCSCSDKISYPNKFVFNLLEQLKIGFQTEYKPVWSEERKYDFYFELNNEKYVIEAHGGQHYEASFSRCGGRTTEEEIKNDKIKKELALNNGIKEENYIVINCRESEMEWIRDNVLISKLNELFNLNNINWNECEEFALSNRVKEACELWNNGINNTLKIGESMNMNRRTILNYLKKGAKLGWCNYDPKEESVKNNNGAGKRSKEARSRPVEILDLDGNSLGIFKSLIELEIKSEELFGVKLWYSLISKVCNGRQKAHKGFTFKYA